MKHPKPPNAFLAAPGEAVPAANRIDQAQIYPGRIKMKLMAGTFVLDAEQLRELLRLHDACGNPWLAMLHFSRGEFDVADGKKGKVVVLGERKRA